MINEFKVTMDSDVLVVYGSGNSSDLYGRFVEVSLPISKYANGQQHFLGFFFDSGDYEEQGWIQSYYLDLVSFSVNPAPVDGGDSNSSSMSSSASAIPLNTILFVATLIGIVLLVIVNSMTIYYCNQSYRYNALLSSFGRRVL